MQIDQLHLIMLKYNMYASLSQDDRLRFVVGEKFETVVELARRATELEFDLHFRESLPP